MQRPQFFIVGAPRCGTTALHSYLGQHPYIFLCKPKEPNFFATDFPTHRYVTEMANYLRLFRNAGKNKAALGEASAWYLYSNEALANIHLFDPDAKIIVMVRNPADMVPSLHAMLLQNFAEDVTDVERAWDLQKHRRVGMSLPRGRNRRFDPKTCLYSDVCKLGNQIHRAMQIFPRHHVHVVVFDDFVSDTQSCYEKVLAFLEIPSDGRKNFPRINAPRSFKLRRLVWFIWKFRDIGSTVKQRLGILRSFGVLERLSQPFERIEKRPSMSSEFRQRLLEEFGPDIKLLSELIERDLSGWLRESGTVQACFSERAAPTTKDARNGFNPDYS